MLRYAMERSTGCQSTGSSEEALGDREVVGLDVCEADDVELGNGNRARLPEDGVAKDAVQSIFWYRRAADADDVSVGFTWAYATAKAMG